MSSPHDNPAEYEAKINTVLQSTSQSVQMQIGLLVQTYKNYVPPRALLATSVEAAIYTLCAYEQGAADHAEGKPPANPMPLDWHRSMFFTFMALVGTLRGNDVHCAGGDVGAIAEHPMILARDWLAKIIAPEPVPQWVEALATAAQAEQENWVVSRTMGEPAGRA